MKILSLFDGISIAQQALKNLGVKDVEYYASEIDKYAIQITQKNFPKTVQLGDVKDVTGKRLTNIDLMILGSPCQDLSIAKKNREGLNGKRSGLFWDAIRIHKIVKPKWFVYENVNSMKQEWKDEMLKAVQEIDKNAYMIMINASLVSAQNRKRIFITNIPNVHQPEDRGILLKDVLEDNPAIAPIKSNTIRTSGRGSGLGDKHNWDTIRIGQIGKGGQGDRIYSPEGKSVNLSANGGGRGAKTGLYAIPVALRNRGLGKLPEYNGTEKANSMTTVQTDIMVGLVIPEATKKGYAIATEGQSVDLSFPNSKTRRGRVGNKAKNIMTSQNIGVVQDMIIRKLTPIECERLQSLPDNYTFGISNTQRYKACGNGFNCAVIEHILKNIIL